MHEELERRLGFPFDERRLSPNLRTRISLLNDNYRRLGTLESSRTTAQSFTRIWPFKARFLVILGIISFLAGVYIMMYVKIPVILRGFGTVWTENFAPLLGIPLIVLAFPCMVYALFVYDANKVITHSLKGLRSRVFLEIPKLVREINNELTKVWKPEVSPRVIHVKVDFAQILERLRGKGIWLQAIECPNCSGQLPLPSSGETVNCKYCQKTITAVDIFEKIEGLLE